MKSAPTIETILSEYRNGIILKLKLLLHYFSDTTTQPFKIAGIKSTLFP